jgi:ubiquinone/menaquinone biosynthesis C-methylase UbiE
MQPIYNSIGVTYNNTRKADPYLAERLYILLGPKKEGLYLDIGCGTGNYTVALHNKGLNFIAVDPSDIMLEAAAKKSDSINWIKGTAENISSEANAFDGAIATLTIHHWQNMNLGFAELSRVLKQGSKLVFFTSAPEQTNGYWLAHYFPTIIPESAKGLPAIELIEKSAKENGFKFNLREDYFVKEDLEDLFLQSGKHKPEIYFNEEVRKGISTFALNKNQKEIQEGLLRLRNDLDSGNFNSVKQNYDNAIGDYCFLLFEKL